MEDERIILFQYFGEPVHLATDDDLEMTEYTVFVGGNNKRLLDLVVILYFLSMWLRNRFAKSHEILVTTNRQRVIFSFRS